MAKLFVHVTSVRLVLVENVGQEQGNDDHRVRMAMAWGWRGVCSGRGMSIADFQTLFHQCLGIGRGDDAGGVIQGDVMVKNQ